MKAGQAAPIEFEKLLTVLDDEPQVLDAIHALLEQSVTLRSSGGSGDADPERLHRVRAGQGTRRSHEEVRSTHVVALLNSLFHGAIQSIASNSPPSHAAKAPHEAATMQNLQHRVMPVSLPPESRVTGMYAATHLADAYSIELPSEASKNPEVLARFIFSQLPRWMIGLMRVRDVLVASFGLKTAKHLMSTSAENHDSRIGLFKIYSKERTEIILGEDDKHLDFRLSLLCSDASSPPRRQRLTLSTVVHCHNRLGRGYIFLIAPFHRAIVRSSLRHAARIGWPQAAEG